MRIGTFAAALASAGLLAIPAHAQTEIQWWHSMGGALGETLNELANKFNASQKDYKVVPVFKGVLPESMTAAIAAFRAGNAPHILQVFEVGTATMMAAKGAIMPVAKVMTDAERAVRPEGLPADGDRLLHRPQGQHAVVPVQQLDGRCSTSTRTPSRRPGLDPNQAAEDLEGGRSPPRRSSRRRARSASYTTGWPSWVHIENFSAWHNVPIGTKENGMGGLDTAVHDQLAAARAPRRDARRHVEEGPVHLRRPHQPGRGQVLERRVRDAHRSAPARRRTSGKAAKFDWSVNFLPYHDDVKGAPQNSIIGGASLWVMGGKKPEEYKGVAKFFAFLSRPEVQMDWHTSTGYVPITQAAYELTTKSGFYDKNPGADMRGAAAHQQAADRELEGPALRQLRAGPRGDRGGDGGGVRRQEGREGGARRRGASAATRSCASSRRRTSKRCSRADESGPPQPPRSARATRWKSASSSARRGCRTRWSRRRSRSRSSSSSGRRRRRSGTRSSCRTRSA